MTVVTLAITPIGIEPGSTGSAGAGAERLMTEGGGSAFQTALLQAEDGSGGVTAGEEYPAGLEAPSASDDTSALLIALSSQASLAVSLPIVPDDPDAGMPGTEEPAVGGQEIQTISATCVTRRDTVPEASLSKLAATPRAPAADETIARPDASDMPGVPPDTPHDITMPLPSIEEAGDASDEHAPARAAAEKRLARERPGKASEAPTERAPAEADTRQPGAVPEEPRTMVTPRLARADADQDDRSNRPPAGPDGRTDGPARIEAGEAGETDGGRAPMPARLSGEERSSFEQMLREGRHHVADSPEPRHGRADDGPAIPPAGPAAPPHGPVAASSAVAAPSELQEAGASKVAEPRPVVLLPPERPETPPPSALSLEVNPPDMGPVRVRVVLHDRTVHANVASEHADLRSFLLNHQDRLGEDLRKHGLELGDFHVMPEDRQSRRDDLQQFIEHSAGWGSRDARPEPLPEGAVMLAQGNRSHAVSLFA